MKKALFLLGVILTALTFRTSSFAQGTVPCVQTLNDFFHEEVVKVSPPGVAPKVLNVLGTNPQFGRISKHTAASAYTHLKGVKRKNAKKGSELDRLLRTLGYTGIEDPSFTANVIEPVKVPKGSIGWMGSGSTKYFKAQYGKDFDGFKIFVKGGPCFIYIMRDCGNIFFVDIPPCDSSYPCPDCLNASSFTGTINPYCECTPCPECQETVSQTINVNAEGNIKSGDHITGQKELKLVAEYGGQTLCLTTLTVPVDLAYEYTASGKGSANAKVEIDNQDGKAKASEAFNIPVDLRFGVAESQISFGDNGTIKMTVTKKRFKALKKMYAACPVDASSSEGVSGLTAPVVNTAAATKTSPASNGKAGLKKQTLHFAGSGSVSEVASKEHNPTITVIAHSTKTKKLVKGESADRYLCLGQYSVPGSSSLAYTLIGTSLVDKLLEVCDKDGSASSDKYINLPVNVTASLTKQELKAGNDGKVYIEVSESQYKKLAKRFSRCCSNGDESCY
jgi:hypothetical protein